MKRAIYQEIKKIFLNNIFSSWDDNDFDEQWSFACAQIEELPVHLTLSRVHYQYEYLKSTSEGVKNTSLLLKYGDVFLLWPIFFFNSGESVCMVGSGYKMSFHSSDLLSKNNKKLIKAQLKKFIELLNKFNIESDICFPMANIEKPGEPISELFLESAKHFYISKKLIIKLNSSEKDIWLNFRKSYKPLINNGLKLLENEIFDEKNITFKTWIKFKELHHKVAKRKTRSDKSWELQYNQVQSGKAFLILSYYGQKLLGAALFEHTIFECNYSVGVYDRDYKHLPLGHVLQYIAIRHARSLEITEYVIGVEENNPKDSPENRKIKTIEAFKAGFTKTRLGLIVTSI